MEKLIIISLIMIVLILLYDRNFFKSRPKKSYEKPKSNTDLPNIMGQPKSQPIPLSSNSIYEREIVTDESVINPEDLDIEYDENETLYRQIPKEELDKVFTETPNLEEEQEEWYQHHISYTDNGFAQGVTFEELGTVNDLLQKETLNQDQRNTTVEIVQRLQGTELFTLLENSIEDASIKIAKLLDDSLLSDSNNNSSTVQKSNLSDFDIGEFI